MRAAPQLLSLALTASASAAAASASDGGSAAPNHVIFFLVDDYGFADASFKSALYPTKGLNPPPTLIASFVDLLLFVQSAALIDRLDAAHENTVENF